jgi:hypothetical protein
MYGNSQYRVCDLFTISDNVQEMTIHDQWFIDDHWLCSVNDNIRSVIYWWSLIMFSKWQHTISDLFTISDLCTKTDNVWAMTIYDQWFNNDHW